MEVLFTLEPLEDRCADLLGAPLQTFGASSPDGDGLALCWIRYWGGENSLGSSPRAAAQLGLSVFWFSIRVLGVEQSVATIGTARVASGTAKPACCVTSPLAGRGADPVQRRAERLTVNEAAPGAGELRSPTRLVQLADRQPKALPPSPSGAGRSARIRDPGLVVRRHQRHPPARRPPRDPRLPYRHLLDPATRSGHAGKPCPLR